MSSHTGQIDRRGPGPEWKDIEKTEVDTEAARYGSDNSLSNPIPTKELEPTDINPSEYEVFNSNSKMRTVHWWQATIIFIKMTIGIGVLSIPSSLHTLGAAVGVLFIIFWGLLTTYGAYLLGEYKMRHPSIHSISDGASILARDWSSGSQKWATIARNLVEFDFVFTWIVCGGVTTLAFTIALSAVSSYAASSAVFGATAYLIIATLASIKKINDLKIIAWVGFVSILAAILTVVIAVTQKDRPAAAPQIGPYDLGYKALPAAGTTFASAFSGSLAIFSSTGNTPAFLPIISEMKKPKHYFRSVYVSMGFINVTYIALGLTMFAYIGKWVTSPALGSAGLTIKRIAYALAIPGLISGAVITIHVAAKQLFVRILRNTKHLEANTKTHWLTWLTCSYGLGLIAWVFAEFIPFFSSLLALIGALGFAPLAVCLPTLFWFHMNPDIRKGKWKQKFLWLLHFGILLVGLFTIFAGTYAVISEIIEQYGSRNVN